MRDAPIVLYGLVGGLLLFCVFGFIMAVRQDAEHEKFLQQHGCQLLMSAETGRTHLVGKIRHYEKVYVYECADGTRTEVE